MATTTSNTPTPSTPDPEPGYARPDAAAATARTTSHGAPAPGGASRNPDHLLVAENLYPAFYLAQLAAPDEVTDPVAHFMETGWKAGLDPHPDFSTCFYLARSPDVAKAGINPYLHYLQWGRREGRAPSPGAVRSVEPGQETDPDLRLLRQNLDREFYCARNPRVVECHVDPVLHYHLFGWREGHDPSPLFSVAHYLAQNADVRETGMDPFLHYLKWGRVEGRPGHPDEARQRYAQDRAAGLRSLWGAHFDRDFYLGQATGLKTNAADPLLHYAAFGWRQGFDPARDFSTDFYVKTHPETVFEGGNPLSDYLLSGREKGAIPRPIHPLLQTEDPALRFGQQKRMAGSLFDPVYYREAWDDIRGSDEDLLEHYLNYGWRENRDPAPWFSGSFYRRAYPQFECYGIDPLTHYRIWGRDQGLRTLPGQARGTGTGGPAGHSSVRDGMLTGALPPALTSAAAAPTAGYDPDRLDIHWVIPNFGVGGGGHMTIFRTIHWLEYFGHRCTIWIKDSEPVGTDAAYDRILKHYQFVKAEVRAFGDAFYEVQGDLAIATAWDTAFAVAAARGMKDRAYFIQDYEPYFYARGSRGLMAEMTYGLDLACICASPWLRQLMETRHGRWAREFHLSYDRDFYYPPAELARGDTRPRIALYSRIGTERRCVELALLALEDLAARGVDFHVDIFGTDQEFTDLPFPSTFHGVVDSGALGALYRQCDIGICFSATNYSLVPQEMMACGLPVVELDVESARHSIQQGAALMAGPLPSGIADALEGLLGDEGRRRAQAEAGLAWAAQHSWEAAARSVEAALKERLAAGPWTAATPAAPARIGKGETKASVIIPTLNGGALYAELLDRLAEQKTDFPFELVVIDSGSQDGTVELTRKLPFARVLEVPKAEFQHGRTRNVAAAASGGEYLAFLTQDALPADTFWLYNFISTMDRFPEAAGAFGKHYAHRDASAYTRMELRSHFAGFEAFPLLLTKHSDIVKWNVKDRGWIQLLHFYSDNNSCMRRSAWQEMPYPEVDYGEDQLWALEAIRRGWGKLYCPNAVVYHSHDYDYDETLERAEVEAWFFHKYFGYDLATGDVDAMAGRRNANTERLGARHGLSRAEIDKRRRNNLAQLLGWELGRRRSQVEESR